MSTIAACPLCGDQQRMNQPKKLYGYDICKRCSSKFANRRQFAYFLDIIFVRILQFVAAVGLGLVLATEQDIDAIATILILVFVIALLAKDGFSGTSPGKALMGVQAVDEQTRKPIGFAASIKRNLPTLVPIAPIVIAFQLIQGKRWGDGWAGTQVIWKKYADNPVFGGALNADTGFGPAELKLPPVQQTANPYQSPRQ